MTKNFLYASFKPLSIVDQSLVVVGRPIVAALSVEVITTFDNKYLLTKMLALRGLNNTAIDPVCNVAFEADASNCNVMSNWLEF